jgi:hypothetical protein
MADRRLRSSVAVHHSRGNALCRTELGAAAPDPPRQIPVGVAAEAARGRILTVEVSPHQGVLLLRVGDALYHEFREVVPPATAARRPGAMARVQMIEGAQALNQSCEGVQAQEEPVPHISLRAAIKDKLGQLLGYGSIGHGGGGEPGARVRVQMIKGVSWPIAGVPPMAVFDFVSCLSPIAGVLAVVGYTYRCVLN